MFVVVVFWCEFCDFDVRECVGECGMCWVGGCGGVWCECVWCCGECGGVGVFLCVEIWGFVSIGWGDGLFLWVVGV